MMPKRWSIYVRSRHNPNGHIEPYTMDLARDIYGDWVENEPFLLCQRGNQVLHAGNKNIALCGNEFWHDLN